jgi:hypothetical protein
MLDRDQHQCVIANGRFVFSAAVLFRSTDVLPTSVEHSRGPTLGDRNNAGQSARQVLEFGYVPFRLCSVSLVRDAA